jgi:hypothetical protein
MAQLGLGMCSTLMLPASRFLKMHHSRGGKDDTILDYIFSLFSNEKDEMEDRYQACAIFPSSDLQIWQ